MNKLFAKAMDPISSETHFIGACLSLLGLLVMIVIGIKNQIRFKFNDCCDCFWYFINCII